MRAWRRCLVMDPLSGRSFFGGFTALETRPVIFERSYFATAATQYPALLLTLTLG